jgi:hypothetical protein
MRDERKSELVEFLVEIATSPERATFAIVDDSPRAVFPYVIAPMREIVREGMHRASDLRFSVFGRNLHIVTCAQQLRGLMLNAAWCEVLPDDVSLGFLKSRLIQGGRLYG